MCAAAGGDCFGRFGATVSGFRGRSSISCHGSFWPRYWISMLPSSPSHTTTALWRGMQPALPVHLIEPVVMPHYPIVSQHSLRLQTEDLPAPLGSGIGQMIIRLPGRIQGEPLIVIVAILLFQVLVHRRVRGDALAPQFLH